ncbi:MAG: radical SAM protein [Ignavibacteriales bacterium]|nr:MAG: radical SAM protein [Ignavibacteriales bacterium]
MKKKHSPIYLRKIEVIGFLLRTLIFEGIKSRIIREAYSLRKISKILKLRKKLLLTKIIKFNNKYYSTLSIPGSPSPAYNNMIKNGGMNFSAAGTDLKKQIDTVLLAITSKCMLKCSYCYEKQNLNSDIAIPGYKWIEIVEQLQARGTSNIILTGGEPLTDFEKLLKILEAGDKNLSDFHIHTSGYSITKEKVKSLKEAGLTAAGVGLDDYRPKLHNKIRGNNSFEHAVKALRMFNEAGILTYVNFTPGSKIMNLDDLLNYLSFVKSLNVSLVELLEPRRCGGFINYNIENLFNKSDKNLLNEFTVKANTEKKYKNHPLVYYLAHIEGKDQMGCMMGGLSHFYIDSAGNVNPCVFMPVSFGNIINDNFDKIFKRMRSVINKPIHSECPSILMSESIKSKILDNEVIPVPFTSISADWKKILIN